MDALTSMDCFEARYPTVTSELRDSLFGVAKDLFALPLETKLLDPPPPDPEKPFHGYLGNIGGLHNFESLAIMNGLMETLASVNNEKVLYFAKQLPQLEEIGPEDGFGEPGCV